MPDTDCASLPADARILVVRLSALGDLVFALPAVTALRQLLPHAHIDWLVEDRHASLVRTLPGLDRVRVFPRRGWKSPAGLRRMWRHWRELRGDRRYDCVLDLQGNLKSALQARRVRSPLRIGFARGTAKEGAHRLYHRAVATPARCHRADRDLALLAPLGWHGPAPAVEPWALDSAIVKEMETAWPRVTAGARRILLHHAVTDYGRDKEWLPERWAGLARALALADAGDQVFLLWTPAEKERALGIAASSEGAARLAPATPSLAHLMALLDQADLVIGTDSGPVHLAAVRGQQVVALFGPTDPLRFRPPGPHCELVCALPMDQPPPKRERSRRSPLMDQITVETVLAAARGNEPRHPTGPAS